MMFGRATNSGSGDAFVTTVAETTPFVRILNKFFKAWGTAIAGHPWFFIGISLLFTAFCSLRIPFTPMTNDVSDFTPYGARARRELQAYEAFFSNKGDPVVLTVLIKAKSMDGNMLGVEQLEGAVQLLNMINENIKVFDVVEGKNVSFGNFCDNFCTINEPVRHFYSGLLLERNFGNSSLEHIDLGYPITTVLGRQLHMDPHFFGVKIAIRDPNNDSILNVSVNKLRTKQTIIDHDHKLENEDSVGRPILLSTSSQLPNNIREIKLVGLHFRAVRPVGVSRKAMADWQRSIAQFVHREFKNDFVDALVLSETLLTDEVVRAGLTLLPFLVIGFVIMVTFSSITMSLAAYYMGQMGAHKILLAFVACICPFMACGTALGGMFWLGFRFGSILCVTPFLVLALGVDDAYLMLNAWQRLRKKVEREWRGKTGKTIGIDFRRHMTLQLMTEVMVDSGASITITTLTNVLAFGIGAGTPTPEIQLFSIGNALAIIIVYIYQWTVFGSAMVLLGEREFIGTTTVNKLERTGKNDEPPRQEMPQTSILELEVAYGTTTARATAIDDDTDADVDNDDAISKGSSEADSGINVKEGSLTSTISRTSSNKSANDGGGNGNDSSGRRRTRKRSWSRAIQRFLYLYCRALANFRVLMGVLALLIAYIYVSIYGVLNIRAELKPEQLFLQSSNVQRILTLRNDFIMPFYAVCLVFVNLPGNFSDPVQRQKWHALVADFEALPSSVGRFSTKFWLRDYEQFVESETADDAAVDDLVNFEGISLEERQKDELAEFLQWPEFQFWNGFIQLERDISNISSSGNDSSIKLNRFFFMTASFGAELKEWSKREQLLGQWRRVADSYPDLEVSVYEDEAKFLDLIPTMIPQTLQSTVCTLFCMFLVCLLFMTNPSSLLISNFAIFSTCIGVFGIQSLMGTALDPIFMSAAIMSIGFSVDIPAHIAYHFYKTGVGEKASQQSMEERLRECLSDIAFPILEAGLSTLICVSSLFFVNLHMARVFANTMTLVVMIGLVHGLVVIPALLCQLGNLCPSAAISPNNKSQQQKNMRKSMETKQRNKTINNSKIHQVVFPTVLAINQQDESFPRSIGCRGKSA